MSAAPRRRDDDDWEQPNLLDLPVGYQAQLSIQEAFERFHRDNPHVYDELVKLARRARRAGHKRMGVQMLFEIVRWRRMMVTSDISGFKLNDHYTSRYARLMMDQEPDLEGFFETRRLKAP